MNATEKEQLAQWLHAKRSESSLAKIADRFGCAKSTWQRYESGEREPPNELLRQLVEAYPDAPYFVRTILQSTPEPTLRVQEKRGTYDARASDSDDFVDVPLYDVSASLGGGAVVEKERVKTYLKFRRDWLEWTTGTTRDLYLVTVRGDSMLPTITDGSVVLMRPLDTWNVSSGIYLLRLDGRLCVKRVDAPQLEAEPGTANSLQLRATIISDNAKEAMPREVVFSDENSADTSIIARALWLGVKLP